MRQAGTVPDETQARRLIDYLMSIGIRGKTDGSGNAWAIWIFDEGDIERSKAELAQFVANPTDSRYTAAAGAANAVRKEQEKKQREFQKNYVEMRDRWDRPRVSSGKITVLLMLLSCAASVVTRFGDEMDPIGRDLSIAEFRPPHLDSETIYWPLSDLVEVRRGEIWRLITPIFLHFKINHIAFMHLGFNMYWLYVLGSAIETRRGSLRYLSLVLAIAAISNLSQYYFCGPGFGGMSGVNYGLLGYLWMKSRFQPSAGLYIDPTTVYLMLGWFVICISGSMGNVANYAHGVGLAVGMVVGYFPVLLRR